MDKQSLLELLADNQLGELFNALKNEQGYYKELILLESRWNDLQMKQRNDLISNEQADIEIGQIRNSLLQLIELSNGQRAPIAAPTPINTASNRSWVLIALACVGILILFAIYHFTKADNGRSPATRSTPGNAADPSRPLNVSEARPVTISAGDSYYERVYSVVKTGVESTGGGKSLITLTIGLNFKGSINYYLNSDKFRLIAEGLPGPLAPANLVGLFVDSKSCVEGDIKFELSDEISRFTIVIEGIEDKKWNFSR